MGSAADIIEISSDEDDADDWISELLDNIDDAEIEGLDDVIVLDEQSVPFSRKRGAPIDDSDDDCLVLDGDPDKPVVLDDKCGGGESEDVIVVGEKGQLACRDYPHPRHLCATFPFSSTPHEKYCSLCHCYVCDSQAPCIYWNKGIPCVDHCHATDKEGKWKTLRKYIKLNNQAPLPQNSQNSVPVQPSIPTTYSSHSNSLRPCPSTSVTSRYSVSKRHMSRPFVATHQTSQLPHPFVATHRTHTPRQHRSPIVATHRAPAPSQHPLPIVATLRVQIPGQNQRAFIASNRGPAPSQHQRPIVDTHRSQVPSQHSARTVPVQREKHNPSLLAAQIMQPSAKIRRVETTSATSWTSYNEPNCSQVYRPAPQRVECPGAPQAVEESMKKWQDLLKGVAAELGVSGTGERSGSSEPPHQIPAPPSANSSSVGFDYGWLRDSSMPLAPGEIQAECGLVSSVDVGPLQGEPGKEDGFMGLAPEALLYDIDSAWGSMPQV